MKKLYISDMDQTLLDENAELSLKQKEKLNELIKGGTLFTVASARSVKAIQQILKGVNFRLPVIEFNGAFISDFHTGKHLVINSIAKSYVSSILKIASNYNKKSIFSLFNGEDRLFFPPDKNGGLEWYRNDRIKAGDPRFMPGEYSFSQNSEDDIVCLNFIDRKETLQPLYNEISKVPFADKLSIHFLENRYSTGWHWLTIHAYKAQKHIAVKELIKYEGIKDHELVVFGDNLNDLSMFKIADRSYAVSNGVRKLKDVATGVIGHHNNGAVVDFIVNEVNRIAIFPLTLDELQIIDTAAKGEVSAKKTISGGHFIADIVEIINDRKGFKRAVKIKIEKMEKAQKFMHPWLTYWLIVHLKTGKPVGFVGFKGFPEDGSAEVGYGIHSEHEGKGYAGEALKLILKWAEKEGKCRKVTATRVDLKNIGSQKVLERNGFKELRRDELGVDYVYEVIK